MPRSRADKTELFPPAHADFDEIAGHSSDFRRNKKAPFWLRHKADAKQLKHSTLQVGRQGHAFELKRRVGWSAKKPVGTLRARAARWGVGNGTDAFGNSSRSISTWPADSPAMKAATVPTDMLSATPIQLDAEARSFAQPSRPIGLTRIDRSGSGRDPKNGLGVGL